MDLPLMARLNYLKHQNRIAEFWNEVLSKNNIKLMNRRK
jgi:hypothetical protein